MKAFLRNTSLSMILAIFSLALVFCAQAPESHKNENKENKKGNTNMIRGHVLHTVLQPGEIPAIFAPEFITVAEADKYYYPDEPLIAVVEGDVAKGYSTWHLDRHEIVNDFISGKAITVTW
jgi:hypothetical protein